MPFISICHPIITLTPLCRFFHNKSQRTFLPSTWLIPTSSLSCFSSSSLHVFPSLLSHASFLSSPIVPSACPSSIPCNLSPAPPPFFCSCLTFCPSSSSSLFVSASFRSFSLFWTQCVEHRLCQTFIKPD